MLGAAILIITKAPALTGALTSATLALGLTVWRLLGRGPDAVDLLVYGAWAMSATGFVCYSLHRYRPDMQRALLHALMATPPPHPRRGLRAVPDPLEGTGSRTASAQESAG